MSDQPPILIVDGLKRYFPVRNDWGVRTDWLKALDGVSLSVNKGEVVGVVSPDTKLLAEVWVSPRDVGRQVLILDDHPILRT